MRVAKHQPIARVPEHESLRDRLDRVAQPQIGLDGSLRKAFLFGNVDRDAYQVHARVVGAMAELATDTKPDPVSAAVLHPESLIDVVDLARQELSRDREQIDIIGFYQRIDLAKGQKIAAAVQAQHGEHGL